MKVLLRGRPERPILLIKAVREATGLDLRSSKQVVDRLLLIGEVEVLVPEERLDRLLAQASQEDVLVVDLESESSIGEGVRARARAMGLEEVLRAPGIVGVLYSHFRSLDGIDG